MQKFKKYQQCFLGIITSLMLVLIGLAILGISLFQANRNQAATINQIKVNRINLFKK